MMNYSDFNNFVTLNFAGKSLATIFLIILLVFDGI